MAKLLNFSLSLLSWILFIYVILFVDYPPSLTLATPLQIFLFFSTFFIASTLTFILVMKSLLISSVLSLGVVILLILKGLDSLNLVSGGLTIIALYLLISYFRKSKLGLTSSDHLPKLTNLKRKR